jgi:hypothetical protein
MIRTHVLPVVFSVSIAASLHAQAPSPGSAQTPSQPRTTPQSAANHENATVTLTGCLYRERDVPGRTPNVAERAGILEDYILADAMMAGKSNAGAHPAAAGAATDTKSDHSTMPKMFKVENIDDDKLRTFVGKRVEVMGKMDVESGDTKTPSSAQTDRSVGPDRIELPEFEATSIKEATGTCPATPTASR